MNPYLYEGTSSVIAPDPGLLCEKSLENVINFSFCSFYYAHK